MTHYTQHPPAYDAHTVHYSPEDYPKASSHVSSPYATQSTPSAVSTSTVRDQRLKEFFRKYEISPYIQEDISEVAKYEIIIIADDSSSMREASEYISIKTGTVVRGTRWSELRETIEVLSELATILDDDGIDIWFLNKGGPYKNITSKQQVAELFNDNPTGRTPLTKVTRQVINTQYSKPKLILIATDGEPTDDEGYSDSENFISLLKYRECETNRVSILACTTNETVMKFLNRIDKECERVDVIDDYNSERDEILAVQGKGFSYSHGDHILKMLLGAVLQKYDDLDEKPLHLAGQASKYKSNRNRCSLL